MATKQTDNSTMWIIVAVAGYLFYTGQIKLPSPTPSAPDGPVIVVPADLSAAAAPIKQIALGNPAVAREAAKAFQDFKDVVVRDDKRIANTDDLRNAVIAFEELLWLKTRAVGALPGFSAAASNVVTAAVGSEVVPLDAVKRKRASEAFDAISVALGG